MNALDELASLGSTALAEAAPRRALFEPLGPLGRELFELLMLRNGFYAFESALHIFGDDGVEVGLSEWNSDELWRHVYGSLSDGYFFFAEDVFGGQFAIRDRELVQFDPETGEATTLAPTLERWAEAILDDYEVLTGYPLAHEWQVKHGPIPAGSRLVPKIPFVCRGMYEIDNLALLDAVEGMRVRGELARQLRDLPEGAQISFRVSD